MLKADRLCKTSCGWGGLAVRSDFCTVLKPGFGLWPTVTQGGEHSEIKRSNTHEYDLAGCSALLFQYRQTQCKSARHGWEVETNFSVDDPAGKGVQMCKGANVQRCKCANVQMYPHPHMQRQAAPAAEERNCFVHCSVKLFSNYKLLHCALPLPPLLKYPFLAIFLMPHIHGWGDMLMRGYYLKTDWKFVLNSHLWFFLCLSKITSWQAENNDMLWECQKKWVIVMADQRWCWIKRQLDGVAVEQVR